MQNSVLQIRAQATFDYDIDFATEQRLQILLKPDLIKKTSTWLEIDKHVHVAVRASFAADDRTEEAHGANPILSGKAQDDIALVSNLLETLRMHVISLHQRDISTV